MPPHLTSPERILPTRMTLHVPANTPIRFSVLDFPYAAALQAFMRCFEAVYRQKHGKATPFHLRLPWRQLNDMLLTLAPSLIQGFEDVKDGEMWKKRMVALTRSDRDGQSEDFPSQQQLQSLFRFWLECWSVQSEVQGILQADGRAAWQTLMDALDDVPETEWTHGITPHSLANDLKQTNSLAYIALPALLTVLLHTKPMTIQSEKGEYPIRWRRANQGGKNGLHLVSQPLPFQGHYFAYRLDFSVQTQAGYSAFWIFAHLSIQRYITGQYRSGDKHRNISVLVGYNREGFVNGNRWDDDTTLIRLGVDTHLSWEGGIGRLLNDFSVRSLLTPGEILKYPARYGIYGDQKHQNENEYYAVYAEGRKFGDASKQEHQVKTGTSMRERSGIMEGVLRLLDGWLKVSLPLEYDTQNPQNTFALRDYSYMTSKRKDNTKQARSWRAALQASLANSGYTQAHLVVLYRQPVSAVAPKFEEWADKQLEEALMGVDKGDSPLVRVTFQPLPALLYAPLDPGDLDPQMCFKPASEKPANFNERWHKQMRLSYRTKRDAWSNFLQGIDWQTNARRLVLIDSPGNFDFAGNKLPYGQAIKGAVREACVREGISSQFIVGNLKLDTRPKFAARLNGNSAGRLKNGVLDLLLRQQGILYTPPREIYQHAAKLDAATAAQLDVVAFCRVEHQQPKLNYVLAVRLRAGGEVDVLLPDDTTNWLPYDVAAYRLGKLFAEQYVPLRHSDKSSLRVDHRGMVKFVETVLTQRLERPTIAVIEAEGWRNARGQNEDKHCWTQLRNPDLTSNLHVLRFNYQQTYLRHAPILDQLLGVVRLRMNAETPQYITADDWATEEPMRDIDHLTGYIDPCVAAPLHYMSIAGLPDTQKKQKGKRTMEAFKADPKDENDNLAYKHPQMVELVPFFVHPRFQHDEGQRQLCRCIHFLRISPGFTAGEIILPYPMHLGEIIVEDMLCIVGMED